MEMASWIKDLGTYKILSPLKIFRVGDPNSRLVLVLGPNSAGKSLFRKFVCAWGAQQSPKLEVIHLSMEKRSASGIVSAMIYGDESHNSTGVLSARVVRTGIKTCHERKNNHILFFDEPDIGASPELSMGIGQYLAQHLPSLEPKTEAIFITSHSNHLIQELVPLSPQVLFIEQEWPSLGVWLKRDIVPVDLEQLADRSLQKFREIQAVIDGKKKQ